MSPGDVDVEEAGTASVLGVHRGRGGAALSAPIPLGYKPPRSVQPPGVGSRLWQALRVVVAVALALGCFGVGIAVAPLIVSGRGDDKSGGTSAVNGIVGGTGCTPPPRARLMITYHSSSSATGVAGVL